MQNLQRFLAVSALFLLSGTSLADLATVEARSGATRATLLELYTSEGCSSCPPADEFVNRIGRSTLFPTQVIPLSFHVTYWDYIGWNDPFARPEYDQRQRAIAARLQSRSVYTPQLLLNGGEMRGAGNFAHQLQTLQARQPDAHIHFKAVPDGARTLRLTLQAQIPNPEHRREAGLYVALYENRLRSQVKAGENRGKTLEHEQVVRKLYGPIPLAGHPDEHAFEQTIELPDTVDAQQAGLAVFVQNLQNGGVLQALASPL